MVQTPVSHQRWQRCQLSRGRSAKEYRVSRCGRANASAARRYYCGTHLSGLLNSVPPAGEEAVGRGDAMAESGVRRCPDCDGEVQPIKLFARIITQGGEMDAAVIRYATA